MPRRQPFEPHPVWALLHLCAVLGGLVFLYWVIFIHEFGG